MSGDATIPCCAASGRLPVMSNCAMASTADREKPPPGSNSTPSEKRPGERSSQPVVKPDQIAPRLFGVVHRRIGPLQDVVRVAFMTREQGHADADRAPMFDGPGGRSLEVMAGRVSRGPWNKCERGIFLLRLCRESLLTSCKPSTLEAGAGEGLIIPGRCLTASAGFGAEPQGLGRRVPRRCGGNEFGRRRTARRPSGTSSPWESTWRALSAVCLNTEQLLVGTCRKAVTTYLQGWL
jgi:hypothetical protein